MAMMAVFRDCDTETTAESGACSAYALRQAGERRLPPRVRTYECVLSWLDPHSRQDRGAD
jgi:hypothetical protein